MRKAVAILFIAVAFIAGTAWYRAVHGTPVAAMNTFVAYLAEGETQKAYIFLTPNLTKGREPHWQEYLKQLSRQNGKAVMIEEVPINDTFNTYTQYQDPHRYTYILQVDNRAYRLTIIAIKDNKGWRIDELYGAYAAH